MRRTSLVLTEKESKKRGLRTEKKYIRGRVARIEKMEKKLGPYVPPVEKKKKKKKLSDIAKAIKDRAAETKKGTKTKIGNRWF